MRSSMDQSYLDYWGFQRAPFALTPDPDMLYLSKQHRECLLRLQYAIAGNKGGALLVSENPGDGKTSVLRRLEKDLKASEEEQYRIVFIDHPTLTPNQMLWEILRQLGLGEVRGEKIQNLLQLREALLEMYERGQRCIFILDEGQLLAERPELMQEFRVLLNYTVGDTFLLTFIFSGQSELEGAMKRLPEFYQRLPVRYFLHSMDLTDTGRMLEYRIKVAGYRGAPLFSERAIREIYRYARGIPRVICSVADLCLVVGHSRSVRTIHDREVFMAIRDLDRSTQDGYHYYHFLRSAGSATPEEEQEIQAAEEELDRREAEAALERLESAESGVNHLAARIESWTPSEELSGAGEELSESELPAAEDEVRFEPEEEPVAVEEVSEEEPADEPFAEPAEGEFAESAEEEETDEPVAEPVAEESPEEEPEDEPFADPAEGESAESAEEEETDEPFAEPVEGESAESAEEEPADEPVAEPVAEESVEEEPADEEEDGEESAVEEPVGTDVTGDESPFKPLWVQSETAPDEMVHCPMCGTLQPSDRTTCVQCSGPLYWICPSCQHRNAAQRPRCDRCGQSLSLAVGEAESALRELVTSSAIASEWGLLPAPDFSLTLAEGEKILAVLRNKPLFGRGVSIRARAEMWGEREKKADVVLTNHRLHVVAGELQSRIPYHEIQGVRATSGKIHLFHAAGGVRISYPGSDSPVYELIHALLDFLEFQTQRYRV